MRIPTATYRLQVHADFTLHDAARIVAYLHALGITDLYLSPIFEAAPGSTHGYDVTDPTRVGGAVGGAAAFAALSDAVRARGMGILLDIVPNHMAASEHTPWWHDVLLRGPASAYAAFFDVDWGTPAAPRRLLLPILGGTLAEVIERGELKLARGADGSCTLDYFGRRLPVAEARCAPGAVAAYAQADEAARRRILHEVLAAQHYELAHWHVAASRLGYRRFFDITDLAGVRVEADEVFDATHALIEELVRSGRVTGLRVDHVDGLRDPAGYLERLRARTGTYLVVEKILERDEPMPRWPVEGTTGYEFLNFVNGLFIDPAGHERIARSYDRLTGEPAFAEIVYRKKLLVMDRLFGGERAALAELLAPLLGAPFTTGDALAAITELTAAMPVYRTYLRGAEVDAADRRALEHAFAELARRAPALAARLGARLRAVVFLEVPEALEFVQRWQQFSGPVMAKGFEDTSLYIYTPLISANEVGGAPARPALEVAEFHARMRARAAEWPHALSATATHDTKRGEDTRARINVLSELAEEWSRRLAAWIRRTEDHKDSAAAAAGLEEDGPVPNAKEESLLYQTLVGAWPLAALPDETFVARVKEYLHKAVREGKETTSWRQPEADYESALAEFVEQLLAAPWRPAVRAEIGSFAERIAFHGVLNSLAQTVLKIAAPGVPDFFQGTELYSLVLVDPDNRQPVDYEERRARLDMLEPLLAAPRPEDVAALLREWRSGDIKLYLTAAALRFRRARAALFAHGSYRPLEVRGERAAHVVAFMREHEGAAAVCIVPRLLTRLCAPGTLPGEEAWGDTEVVLPRPLRLRSAFTGEGHRASVLRVAWLLGECPVFLAAAEA